MDDGVMDDAEQQREARDRRAVLAELGLPAGTLYHRLTLRRPDARHNSIEHAAVLADGRAQLVVPAFRTPLLWAFERLHTVAVYGVAESWDTTIASHAAVPLWAGSAGEAALPLWAYWPDAQPAPLIVLRTTARRGASPLRCELRWRPDGTWTEALTGLELPHRKRDVELAWQERSALRELVARPPPAGGRPPGTYKIRPALFRELTPALWREFVAHYGHLPSNAEFAAYIGMPLSTFNERLAGCRAGGMPWPPI